MNHKSITKRKKKKKNKVRDLIGSGKIYENQIEFKVE